MIDRHLEDTVSSDSYPENTDALDTTEFVRFEPTRLVLRPDTPFEVWQAVMSKLRDAERSLQFWVGDALVYGEAHYGEAAFADLERQDKTLANWATVSRGVAPSRRRESLRFSHHAEVVSLKPEQQTEVLDKAEENDWTVRETREEVERVKQESAEREFGNPEVIETNERCEHCGAPEWAWERRPNG